MFAGSTRVNYWLSALLVAVIGGCGGMDGCAGHPLPQGGLPGYQTIEGGAQIRVTPAGFAKLTSMIPGLINSALSGGFCTGPRDVGNVNFCSRIVGGACGRQAGCDIHVGLVPGSVRLSPASPATLHIAAAVKLDARVYVKIQFVFTKLECEAMRIHGDSIPIGVDIETGISAATGALALRVARVTNVDIGAIQLSDCGIISDIADAFSNVFARQIQDAAIAAMTPLIQTSFQNVVPDTLGLERSVDMGQLIGTHAIAPAGLETRLVAGGYANFTGNGLNLGVVTGVNSDADPETRGSGRVNNVPLASEPHRCVPAIAIPDLAAPPHTLLTVNRSAIASGPVFALAPSGEFVGAPEAAGDLAVGVSQTALNLFGHHLVASGALCMVIGTPSIPQLNLSAFNVILPSIAALQSKDGNDPILFVGRPQRALAFKVGDNTPDSPALTAQISHMEVDLYAFLFERYVRLLTVDLSADVGLNVEFEPSADGGVAIKPVLVGISGSTIKVAVMNSDFIKEKPEDVQTVLPTLFEVALQRIGNIAAIRVPSFAGFTLSGLSLHRVVTDQDSFLAINATLATGPAVRELATRDALAAEAVAALDSQLAAPLARSTGTARLLEVATPAPTQIRDALARTKGGALPSVAFDVDRFTTNKPPGGARELEWSWNLNGGMWRPFQTGSPLVISDPTLALQGKYTVGLRSRVKGEYSTVSDVTEVPVVIDSVGPIVFAKEAAWKTGTLVVPVRDAVGGTDVEVGFGAPGAGRPATAWSHHADASLARAEFDRLQVAGEVAVFARDALGNETTELVAPVGDGSSQSGCACRSTGGDGAGGMILAALGGAALLRRRRDGRAVVTAQAA